MGMTVTVTDTKSGKAWLTLTDPTDTPRTRQRETAAGLAQAVHPLAPEVIAAKARTAGAVEACAEAGRMLNEARTKLQQDRAAEIARKQAELAALQASAAPEVGDIK